MAFYSKTIFKTNQVTCIDSNERHSLTKMTFIDPKFRCFCACEQQKKKCVHYHGSFHILSSVPVSVQSCIDFIQKLKTTFSLSVEGPSQKKKKLPPAPNSFP